MAFTRIPFKLKPPVYYSSSFFNQPVGEAFITLPQTCFAESCCPVGPCQVQLICSYGLHITVRFLLGKFKLLKKGPCT